MDMATDLRMRMAEQATTTAEVARLVGRNRVTVSRWRSGETMIPIECARVLYREGLLSAASIVGSEPAA